jgi:hypothetical protein
MLNVGDLVYYMLHNKVHSAEIISKLTIETTESINACTEQQKQLFEPFGEACVKYATCHGILEEVSIFPSKEKLLESL